VRYLLSFGLEYALWFWLAVVAAACLRPRAPAAAASTTGSSPRTLVRRIGFATILLHFLYYTFVIGGDHFEYRVYSHLVLPILLSFVWALDRLRIRPRAALALFAAFVLLSEPVPWSHWALTRRLATRPETRRMRVALAPHWPVPLRWYAHGFDALQSWLIGHWVCVRHQEHKVNAEYLTSLFPTRAEGEKLPREGFPVLAFQAVGVASWTLPGVNVLDLLGLNDRVVARAPVEAQRFRGMAHERTAPEGYVDCFRPNVFLARGGGVRIVPRDPPLTAADIQACESTWGETIHAARRQRRDAE
jgi:arabinofuranosyltransferase